jgi:hypothetical protein
MDYGQPRCTLRILAIGSATVLSIWTSGCGGGNSATPAPTVMQTPPAPVTPPPPPPAAQISVKVTDVSPTTVILGQSVTVTASTVGVTICNVLPTTIARGGIVLQNNQITLALVPTTAGTVTYTITCGNNFDPTTAVSGVSPPITVTPNQLSTIPTVSRIDTTSTAPQLDRHPYGITVSSASAGVITAGDVLACNFSDAANNAAKGTTLVGMHPLAGVSSYTIAQSGALEGCTGLAALPDGSIVAAAFTSAQIVFVSPNGSVGTPLPAGTFVHPGGIAYAAANSQQPASLYVSDIDLTRPDGGSIYRITLSGGLGVPGEPVQIAEGFCVSASSGTWFGPTGLAYDTSTDTLYFADPSSNEIVALQTVSTFVAKGGGVSGGCGGPPPTPLLQRDETTPNEDLIQFLGQDASLFTPLGVVLLPDGDLVAINGDLPLSNGQRPSSPNLATELRSPAWSAPSTPPAVS